MGVRDLVVGWIYISDALRNACNMLDGRIK
jgi:hypothetical protein